MSEDFKVDKSQENNATQDVASNTSQGKVIDEAKQIFIFPNAQRGVSAFLWPWSFSPLLSYFPLPPCVQKRLTADSSRPPKALPHLQKWVSFSMQQPIFFPSSSAAPIVVSCQSAAAWCQYWSAGGSVLPLGCLQLLSSALPHQGSLLVTNTEFEFGRSLQQFGLMLFITMATNTEQQDLIGICRPAQ